MQRSALCRSRRELSKAYLLAKIGVDTAENEPAKNLQYFAIIDPPIPKDMFRLVFLVKPVFFAREGVAF